MRLLQTSDDSLHLPGKLSERISERTLRGGKRRWDMRTLRFPLRLLRKNTHSGMVKRDRLVRRTIRETYRRGSESEKRINNRLLEQALKSKKTINLLLRSRTQKIDFFQIFHINHSI